MLYKQPSINQSVCLICVHVPVSVSPLCTCTCQCVCFIYMYLLVCFVYMYLSVCLLCVHVRSSFCAVMAFSFLSLLFCAVLYQYKRSSPSYWSIHVTSFMVSLVMTSSSFDYHHSFRIIYKYLKKGCSNISSCKPVMMYLPPLHPSCAVYIYIVDVHCCGLCLLK